MFGPVMYASGIVVDLSFNRPFLSFVLIGIPGLIAFWVWGLIDAYQGAQKWNARHGILS